MHCYENFYSKKSLNHHIDRKHFNIKENTKKNLSIVCRIEFDSDHNNKHRVKAEHSTEVKEDVKSTGEQVATEKESQVQANVPKGKNTADEAGQNVKDLKNDHKDHEEVKEKPGKNTVRICVKFVRFHSQQQLSLQVKLRSSMISQQKN